MDNKIFFIILIATIVHSVWNAMVKKHPDKKTAVSAIVLGHVPLSVLAIFFLPLPTIKSIPYIILSALIHQGYQWFLLKSYSIGDFTKVYPICRGFGPLVATVISILFLGIAFDFPIILSIILISFGIMFLGFNFNLNVNDTNTLKYSLTTGLFIGLYSLIDGYGARISFSAISFISFSFILSAIIFVILIKVKDNQNIILKVANDGKTLFFIGGNLSFLIYVIVVWGFTKAPIPLISALRETSIFFSIFIGYFFLNENISFKKIISICLIVFGVIGIKIF
jgi:drug/metabolite transporter (DMT)-like permease